MGSPLDYNYEITGYGGKIYPAQVIEDDAGNTVLLSAAGEQIRLLSGEIVSVAGTAMSVATGYTVGTGATGAPMTATLLDTDGSLADLTNDYVVIPADATHARVSANVLFAANATGARYVALEHYFEMTTTWVGQTGFYDERPALASGVTPITFTASMNALNPGNFPRLRIGVGQTSGGNLNVTLVGATFEFFKIAT